MEVSVGSEIRVEGYDRAFMEWVDRRLTIPNPEYAKNIRLGFSVHRVPKELKLYKRVGKALVLPFGLLNELRGLGVLRFGFETIFPKARDFEAFCKLRLYPYQKNAVDAMDIVGHGVVVAPCGSGKTNIGLAYIAENGQKALWLTHTQDLLSQSMKRAKEILEFEGVEHPYGRITAGAVDIGECVTFATVQTMAKMNLEGLKRFWNVVVVDECHHAVQSIKSTSMFASVMNQLEARHKFGFTATPYRADKLEVGMFALLGRTIYTVPKEAVEGRTVPYKEIMKIVDYEPDLEVVCNGDGTLNHPALITDLVSDFARNLQIAKDIAEVEGTSLVLSERIAHLDELKRLVGDRKRCRVIKASGTVKEKRERKEALELLERGELDVVFASYALAKEGLDVPSLANVFFASPTDNKAVVVQATGRVMRKAEGKECGMVYDYMETFRPLERKARNRSAIRRRMLR